MCLLPHSAACAGSSPQQTQTTPLGSAEHSPMASSRMTTPRDPTATTVLSVKTHRRVGTGNTKSREVAGALAGTAPSSTARNPGTRHGFLRRRACHLTYTRSGRCERACDDLHAYTNTCKRKSEPWSAPRDDSCIGSKESIESRCRIGSAYIRILINKANNCKAASIKSS